MKTIISTKQGLAEQYYQIKFRNGMELVGIVAPVGRVGPVGIVGMEVVLGIVVLELVDVLRYISMIEL